MHYQKLIPIILAAFFFFFLIFSVKADYAECYCTFDGNLIIAQSAKPDDCLERCGKIVGGQTDCDGDCESCCLTWCNKVEETESRTGCLESCRKTCDYKKLMSDVISLFYMASGIVAAVMLTLNGIRLFSSENPARREEAKRGIWYILLALGIIVIGGTGITYLMKGVTKPGSEASPIESVEGCGGKILSVSHILLGENIEIYVNIRNEGNEDCAYSLILYSRGKKVETIPGFAVGAKEDEEIKISTTLAKLKEGEAKGEYTVSLMLCQMPTAKEIDHTDPVLIEE